VVRKLADKGLTPAMAFNMFDEDGDEVLTINEITEGLKFHEVGLLDSEYKQLVDTIDQNNDGVLTLKEWEECLTRRFDMQKQFNLIMKNLKITDPLILEEQVLDLTFNIRMLKKEVAVIKKTKGKDMFFRKKKLENETKTAAEKLKELEVKVNQNKNRDAESITMFAQNWKTGGLETAADIEAELEQLTKQKEELTIDYHERQQGYKTSLFTLDQRYNDIIKQSEDVRIRRELKRVTLDRVKAQLQNERDLEAKLDAELEKILGRAVTMADLELLY